MKLKANIILLVILSCFNNARADSTSEFQSAAIEYSKRVDQFKSQNKGIITKEQKEKFKQEVYAKPIETRKNELKEALKQNQAPETDSLADESLHDQEILKNVNAGKYNDLKTKKPEKISSGNSRNSNKDKKVSNSSQQRVNSTTSGAVEAGGAESISFSN